jgi:hypothetical protein
MSLSHVALGVAVSGHHAYVAISWDGLAVVDVSDPTTPHEVGRIDTPYGAANVVVFDGRAYIADQERLWVVDVTDPTRPVECGSYVVPFGSGNVAVDLGYVYVTNWDTVEILRNCSDLIFFDGFECGDSSNWSRTMSGVG